MTERRAFSVAIFGHYQGAVLLIRHKLLNLWLPVGGEIEAGETPLEAARRELREETGLDGEFYLTNVLAGCPDGFLGYEEHPAGPKGLHMNFNFVARLPSDQVVLDSSASAFKFVSSLTECELGYPVNVVQLVDTVLRHAADKKLPSFGSLL